MLSLTGLPLGHVAVAGAAQPHVQRTSRQAQSGGAQANPSESQFLHDNAALAMAIEEVSDPLAYSPPRLPTEYDLSGLIRRTIGISCFLAAACLACLIWAHYRNKRQWALGTSAARMELIETKVLAPRCFLHLVSVDEQHFIVSRDGSGINSITPVAPAAATDQPHGQSFVESLAASESRRRTVAKVDGSLDRRDWPTLDSDVHAKSTHVQYSQSHTQSREILPRNQGATWTSPLSKLSRS